MSHINVTINGRQYRMACEEGQEVRLLKLAESLETRIQSLRGKFGEIGDARLTVMAALTVCDELVDVGNRVRTMEQELTELRDFRNAAVERARMTQTAVVNALNAVAGMGFDADTAYIHSGAMFHLADGASTFGVTMAGGRHAFVPRFEPVEVLQTIAREMNFSETTFVLPPTDPTAMSVVSSP